MDDQNPNAENAIDGAISYAVKNKIGKVITKEIIRVADEEAWYEVCDTLDKMIDIENPPDVVLDFTYGGMNSEVLKSISLTLGLPTVTTTIGNIK